MSHRSDQAADRAARKPRVGVERNDVSNIPDRVQVLPGNFQERRARRSAQQVIEFLQLPALALPAHPLPFLLVPLAFAMEEKKTGAASRRGPMALVQSRDGCDRSVKKFVIPGSRFRSRVRPVCK